MSTAGELIDQIKTEYLTPPSETPTQVPINGALGTDATSIVYTADVLMPEEVAKIGAGTVVEVNAERFFVTVHTTGTYTLTVTPAYGDSSTASHNDGSMMTVSPRHTRTALLRAVADGVEQLFPTLYSVNTKLAVEQGGGIADLADTAASWLIEAYAVGYDGGRDIVPAELVEGYPEVQTGPAVQLAAYWSDDVYVKYARRFTRPTDETDDLDDDCYVDARWESIVKIGAIAGLIARSGIDATQMRYLTEFLEQQGVPPGTYPDLSVGFLRLRQLRLDDAARTLARTHRQAMRMRPVGIWSMGRM